jgi:signal transduction histidine kinase
MSRLSWKRPTWTPSLRSVLLVVNVTVMLLPLGGFTLLRVYEGEMVRQKEAALHAQGAYLAAIFRRELLDALGIERPDQEDRDAAPAGYGIPIAPRWRSPTNPSLPYAPTVPGLELRRTQLRGPHALRRFPAMELDPAAATAGSALLPVMLRAQTLNMDRVWIVDVRGAAVASSLGDEGRALIMWEEVQRALQGEHVSLLARTVAPRQTSSPLETLLLGTPLTVVVAKPVIVGDRVVGAVVLSGRPSQVTEFVYGNRGQLLTALAVLMVVVTLISTFSSLTISEPIQAVIRQTQQVAQGDPEAQKPIRWPILAEVRQLSSAIAGMATVIEERSRYITGFARNVSHEFKTPLTGITGAIELLRDHEGTMRPEERRRFLDNLALDAARLSALLRGLLDFARAEVAGPATAAEVVTAAPVVERVVAQAAAEGMPVTFVDRSQGASTRVATELLESMVGNLLANVRAHCPAGTKAEVALSVTPGGDVEIAVADEGPGISAANLAKVGKPFFTTARKTGGTGLGLAIVQALARAHGGEATVASPVPGTARGTVVVVRLAGSARRAS